MHLRRGDARCAERVELAADLALVQAASCSRSTLGARCSSGSTAASGPSGVGVAQCGHQQQRRVRCAVGEVAQDEQGRLVGPLDVVEHDQQRPSAGGVEDRGRDHVDGPETVVRRPRVGHRNVRGSQRLSTCRHGQNGGAPSVSTHRPQTGAGTVPPAPREHTELLDEPGLADARLADDEHEPALARARLVQPCTQRVQLTVAAEQRRLGAASRRGHADQLPPHGAPGVGPVATVSEVLARWLSRRLEGRRSASAGAVMLDWIVASLRCGAGGRRALGSAGWPPTTPRPTPAASCCCGTARPSGRRPGSTPAARTSRSPTAAASLRRRPPTWAGASSAAARPRSSSPAPGPARR